MKLNKRKCRAFANPDLKFSQNNGVLHASQISYIVRTAIKIIDCHKTLILYIYPRKQVIQSDLQPYMTVFHSKDDFITLAKKEDGSTVWRTSAFNHLNSGWNFAKECAFYSVKDEQRISHYFNNSTDAGFEPLIKTQDAILARRCKERQIAKEKAVINRMAGIPALPRDLKSWIQKSIMPAYFFYNYRRGGKNVPGICSSCGWKIILSDVKQGNKHTCPHCKHGLIAKPRSRRGSDMCDRETCEVIQTTIDGKLVVRIIKVCCHYKNSDIPDIQIYENARQFIWTDSNSEIHTENYYYSHNSGLLTNWKHGNRPVYVQYYHYFEADTCGHLYTKNLPEALIATPWQYCPIDTFYNHFHEPMQVLPFLTAYLKHPRLEHLVKTGFYTLVSDFVYHYDSDCLDENQNRTHKILGIAAEDVSFLRKLDADLSTVKIFQSYTGLKGRQELLLWQTEHKVNRNILPILRQITAHKMTCYLDKQYSFLCLRRTRHGTVRYKEMQDLVTEYRDYLDMCEKMEYDMKNSFVLYPKDLQKSHDSVSRHLKHKTDAKIKREFIAVYKRIAGQFDFEKNGMKIVYPDTPDDVIAEGHALHHCVGRYTDRVANQECVILFLRQSSDPFKPYFTIEIQGKKVVQVRGMKNCAMTPEIQRFITAWEQQILSKPELAA